MSLGCEQDVGLWLTAIAALAVVCAASTAQFLFRGPTMPSWDYRTQLSHDMMRAMLRGPAGGPTLLQFANRASQKYWPILAGLLRKPGEAEQILRVSIPAYPMDNSREMERAGIWAPKLRQIAQTSVDRQMVGEWVTATSFAQNTPAILYFHGGGYVAGSLALYRPMLRRVSQASNLPVFGFDYRLAPGSQYPTQLYDAFCAFQNLKAQGYAERDIVFAGDSAGGNLALALWQLLRPPIRALILMSPRVDVTACRPSWTRFANVDLVDPYTLSNVHSPIWQLLLSPGQTIDAEAVGLLEDPYIAPIHADLSDLPPTLIQVGTAEVMYDDICWFYELAIAQNCAGPGRCPVVLQEYPDMFHVFQAAPLPIPSAIRAWKDVGAFIDSLDTPT
ncbi:hypothetical protein GGF46_005086 [Coemansia sp. RSA 552]|nr:hypothetical protein GGF46_005086 [Coemansia sp. RSA 552]